MALQWRAVLHTEMHQEDAAESVQCAIDAWRDTIGGDNTRDVLCGPQPDSPAAVWIARVRAELSMYLLKNHH